MNFPEPISHPDTCAHPSCDTIVRDARGDKVIFPLPDGGEHRGGACPEHAEWFAEEIAAFNAGEPAAVEELVASAREAAATDAEGQRRLF